MNKVNDLTGKKFGKLTVLKRDENAKAGRSRWICKCECGKKAPVLRNHLTTGHATSCGCARKYMNLKPINPGERFGILTVIG